jgi:hypothetical protein
MSRCEHGVHNRWLVRKQSQYMVQPFRVVLDCVIVDTLIVQAGVISKDLSESQDGVDLRKLGKATLFACGCCGAHVLGHLVVPRHMRPERLRS